MILALLAAAQVAMVRPPRLRPDIDAFPRIASPATPAARRINRALAARDAAVRRSARECLDEGGGNPTSWERRIRVTMSGPEFLSIAVTDDVDCGGAHPSNGHSAIVYDLTTGAAVDWRRLLPARLTGAPALTEAAGGHPVVTLASARLTRLYAQRYRDALVKEGATTDCADTMDILPPEQPMLAWLDATAGGLVLQFDFNQAMQACSVPVTLPIAVLRREGASPRLITALAAARR